MKPRVTLIIPAYNEEHRLPDALSQVQSFCDMQAFQYEVIVVDDGSSDRTQEIVSRAATSWSQLRLVQGSHQGKGGAIRAGVQAAQGEFVAIADVDLSMPIYEFTKFNAHVFSQCDVAIATREGQEAHRYNESILRHLMGRIFNAFVQAMVLPGINDTQCGFKVLPGEIALDLCSQQRISGWGFDVEWLIIALRHGYRIGEVPINWYHDGNGSRISPIRDSLRMMRELWIIRRNLLRGKYDQDAMTPPVAATVQKLVPVSTQTLL